MTNRRKPRRRVHRGRLALVCSVSAIIVIGAMSIVSRSCASDHVVRGLSQRPPIPSAVERGKSDAERALSAPAGTMERQSALLGIRATEHRLRSAGHTAAADDYFNSATTTLRNAGAFSPSPAQ